jgi:hypothetical protein
MADSLLILYPHGLGDCILCTPALRAYRKENPDTRVGFAMMKRLHKARLFENNPYIDEELYILDDPWNDHPNFAKGCWEIQQYCTTWGKEHGYDHMILMLHSSIGRKIDENMQSLLGHTTGDKKCDVYVSHRDVLEAIPYMPVGPYGFIHSETELAKWKNMPKGWAKSWLHLSFGLNEFVEVGENFAYDEIGINAQFHLLRQAKHVCLIDSVYYHACRAWEKQVDLAYFERGKKVYDRVKHYSSIYENIRYELGVL